MAKPRKARSKVIRFYVPEGFAKKRKKKGQKVSKAKLLRFPKRRAS